MKTLKGKIERLGKETVLKAMLNAQRHIQKELNSESTTLEIDPEALYTALRIVRRYVKAGVYRFSDIIEDLYFRKEEEMKELFPVIKSAYGMYFSIEATDVEADQMDSVVRKFSYSDMTSMYRHKEEGED